MSNSDLKEEIDSLRTENKQLQSRLLEMEASLEANLMEKEALESMVARLQTELKLVNSDDQDSHDRQQSAGDKKEKPKAVEQMKIAAAFYVDSRCFGFNDGNDFTADLLLPIAPTVGDVRKALAVHTGIPEDDLLMKRETAASSKDDVVYKVRDNWATVSGDVKDRTFERHTWNLNTDKDRPFPVVRGHRNVIEVTQVSHSDSESD